MRRLSPRVITTTAFFAAALLFTVGTAHYATAQPDPTMSNIIPDGGTGAVQGRVEAIDPANRQITIVSSANVPTTYVAAPNVRMDNVNTGDLVSAQFERNVVFVVAGRGVQPPTPTEDVGKFAHTPGGIPPEGLQLAGTVVKIDPDHSFNVVNPNGGGIYTVQVTDPQRIAMLHVLRVGDSVAVSVSPLTITSLTECGFFGCS